MKKILCCLLIIFCTIVFAGCSNPMIKIVTNNMSDMRINYFMGENDMLYANLSCGYRESNFAYDGVSTEQVECGVLTIEFKNTYSYNSICINLLIDDVKNEYVLTHSPFENKYMVDLAMIVNSNSKVSFNLKNQEQTCELACVSDSWTVDYKKAIEIGAREFSDMLDELYFNGQLNAECYLKVVAKPEDEFAFWYFSIIDKNDKLYSMLINVNDGSVQKRDN